MAGVVALAGHLLSNVLDRRRTFRLKQTEFKVTRYQEFLAALSEVLGAKNYQTQLQFVKSINLINLMGSRRVLNAVKDLVDNYNDPEGSEEAQWQIINRIILEMRSDSWGDDDTKELLTFEFPLIATDIPPSDSHTPGTGQTKSG